MKWLIIVLCIIFSQFILCLLYHLFFTIEYKIRNRKKDISVEEKGK